MLEQLEPDILRSIGADPVLRIIEQNGEVNPRARLDVASRLSQLFLDYERHRPEIFNRRQLQDPLASLVRLESPEWLGTSDIWQRKLWHSVFRDGGLLPAGNDGVRQLTLPQLYILRHSDPQWQFPFCDLPLCIFGITKPSIFLRHMIVEISKVREVNVWLTNPCSEFWEDVEIDRPYLRRWKSNEKQAEVLTCSQEQLISESFEDMNGLKEHRLLQLWGESSCENVRLWCQATDYDFIQVDHDERIPKTQLQILQEGLCRRSPEVARQDQNNDLSLIWVDAPSHVREMEALKDMILHMCDPEHDLYLDGFHPDQACILIADPDSYRPAVEMVFGHREDDSGVAPLRCSIQLRNGSECSLGQALLSMIKLVRGEFYRSEVFSLFRNPTVLSALNMTREDLEALEKLMVELNVFRGLDDGERQDRYGDASPTFLHTWEHAFDRLCAGWMAEGNVMGISPSGRTQETLCHEAPFMDDEALAKFIIKVRELHQLSQSISQNNNIHGFIGSWRMFLEQWIDEQNLGLQNKVVHTQLVDWLNALELYYSDADEDQPEIFLSWLEQLIQGELGPDRLGRAGKMVIAPFREAEVLPHRVIFVAGLDSRFPGGKPHSAIDLMAGARRVGDSNPIAAKKEAMLSILHSAKDRLILSRRARDIETERDLAPSSMWIELMFFLKEFVLAEDVNPTHWAVPLLARESYRLHDRNHEGEPSELSLMALNSHDAKLASLAKNIKVPVLSVGKSATNELPEDQFISAPKTLRIEIKQVFEFLESPLDYRLRRGLGLYDRDQEDEVLIQHEPLRTDRLTEWLLIEQLLNAQIIKKTSEQLSEEQQNEIFSDAVNRGNFPESPLEEVTKKAFHDKAIELMTGWNEFLGKLNHDYALEEPSKIPDQWRVSEPLLIVLPEGSTCHLHQSESPHLFKAKSGSAILLLSINASKPKKHDRYLMKLWLHALWLRAQHDESKEVHLVHLGWDEKVKCSELILPANTMSFSESKEQLGIILTAMLKQESPPFSHHSFEHLPFNTVRKLQETQKDEWDSEDLILELESKDGGGYFSKTEAVRLVKHNIPTNAPALVRERLGPFFSLSAPERSHDKGKKGEGK